MHPCLLDMARKYRHNDQQLDLFSDYDNSNSDAIRPDGKSSLERTPSPNGSGLEAIGKLEEALYEAQEKTHDEMEELYQEFLKQGQTEQQAHSQAWEMVRERYILLPSEEKAIAS